MKGNDMTQSTQSITDEMYDRLRTHNTDMDTMLHETAHAYVVDSIHSDWEGFTQRERRAIMIMLNDMSIYHINKE